MKYTLFSILVLLTACTTNKSNMEIIEKAAIAAPHGVKGEYRLHIKAADYSNGVVYLNTELDYRDQRNITVAIQPRAISFLTGKFDAHPSEFFIGKNIIVKGEAQRQKISFYSQGKLTNKYYYQTHITVRDFNKINLL